jgi:predicted nucleic acid-binding protein
LILVDTSVWVDHLRAGDTRLAALLERDLVTMHPMVIGELACGNLKDRQTLLALWRNLPQLLAATDDEALFFLEHNRLWGRGIGYVDLHLLAAVSLSNGTRLWTRDRRLRETAGQLGLAAAEAGG